VHEIDERLKEALGARHRRDNGQQRHEVERCKVEGMSFKP
jgi:hypothetical protein